MTIAISSYTNSQKKCVAGHAQIEWASFALLTHIEMRMKTVGGDFRQILGTIRREIVDNFFHFFSPAIEVAYELFGMDKDRVHAASPKKYLAGM